MQDGKIEIPQTLSQQSPLETILENTKLSSFDLRASLCKILISSFAHKMDFAHNLSVDFF